MFLPGIFLVGVLNDVRFHDLKFVSSDQNAGLKDKANEARFMINRMVNCLG